MRRSRRIVVHVTWLESKGTHVLRAIDITDPRDRRTLEQRGTGTTSRKQRKDADRQVPAFEHEVLEKYGGKDERASWNTVTHRFDLEQLADLSVGGRSKFWSAIKKFDEAVGCHTLHQIDADAISRFRGAMQEAGLKRATVIDYLNELGRCLRWAADIWTDYRVPTIRKPKGRTRLGMRGRAPTREEFDRMLQKVEVVLTRDHAAAAENTHEGWRHYLIGLWLSGLRLAESLDLTWDRTSRISVCDLDRDRARLYFREQKSGKEGKSPITDGFDRFLRKTPPDKRRGYVFRPLLSRGRVSRCTASKVIAAIGRAALVKVDNKAVIDQQTGATTQRAIHASAHDLRRAFATRLAPRVQSAAILALYLRDTIQTAEHYYVDLGLRAAENAVSRGPRAHDLLHDHYAEARDN